MSSEGVTITGSTIYDVRARLGIRYPWIGIYLSGDTAAPKLRLEVAGDSRVFNSAAALCKYLQPILAKRMIVPKPKKSKRKPGTWRKGRR